MCPEKTLRELITEEYQQRLVVDRLRRDVYVQPNPAVSPLLSELAAAERALSALTRQRAAAQRQDPRSGLILDTSRKSDLLGPRTSGLEVQVRLRMAHVPTAIVHLLDRQKRPLVSCMVHNAREKTARLRITSYVEGYSAQAVDTIELDPHKEPSTVQQLPTFFPERLRDLNELTRATLHVVVEDLGEQAMELHKTEPVWLLARTTAPLSIQDPVSGEAHDMTPYLGAFVTPNAPAVMAFIPEVARQHPERRLVGYQGQGSVVEPQAQAIFDALTAARLNYVHSVIAFNPDQGLSTQRVRLPRESLAGHQANCVDGTVLFASLLEAISLNPAIVIVPGHAFVAWETWSGSGGWKYLETTMIADHSFAEARTSAEDAARLYRSMSEETDDPGLFRFWSLRALRTEWGITPME